MIYSNNETSGTIVYPITAPEEMLKVLEDKRTIFYVFGHKQSPEDANVQLMMKGIAFLFKFKIMFDRNYNFFVVFILIFLLNQRKIQESTFCIISSLL